LLFLSRCTAAGKNTHERLHASSQAGSTVAIYGFQGVLIDGDIPTTGSYRFRAGSTLAAQGIGSLYSYLGDVPNNAVTTEVFRVTMGDGMERIVVRDHVAIGDAPARFMQVQVASP
jgi:hypothetical protein